MARVLPREDDRTGVEPRRRTLECGLCGYGIARSAPPRRCPMCQTEGPWVDRTWSRPGRAAL